MHHQYLSGVTSLQQLFVTDTLRIVRSLSPLTLDHQQTQSESSPLHHHLYALVDGCWLGIWTVVRISGPKPKPLATRILLMFSLVGCWVDNL
jgi:hypothetical protein